MAAAKKDTTEATASTATETEVKTTAAKTTKTATKQERAKVDLFTDTATAVEGMTKGKALAEAVKCAKESDDSLFKLGGLLAKILENKWFDDHETFGDYVFETFGFQERKARYLIEIYVELVNQRIPYEKVAILGWTKIKMLAKLLDINNVDEWVERAGQLSVRELEAVIKAQKGGEDEGEEKNTSTENNVKSINFKLHPDQVDSVNSALAKAKAEKDTTFDNVALEHICNTFLGETTNAFDLVSYLKTLSPEDIVTAVDGAYPDINFQVEL
ncbi:MAG: hypothetical protein RR280_04220 [Bacteroidaceae bacterium]